MTPEAGVSAIGGITVLPFKCELQPDSNFLGVWINSVVSKGKIFYDFSIYNVLRLKYESVKLFANLINLFNLKSAALISKQKMNKKSIP